MYQKVISWYLSREALPYWYVLLTDCCIVFVSGIVAYAVNHGLSDCMLNWERLLCTLFACQFCFLIGFRVFHTYSGIIRKSSFPDLLRSVLALLVGLAFILLLWSFFPVGFRFFAFRFQDLFLQVLLSIVGMCGLRITAQVFYGLYLKRHAGGVYGWSNDVLLNLEMKDLLPRDPIHTDMVPIKEKLCGKRILVTGAAGSIGSKLSLELAACDVGELVLIDQAETSMHEMRMYMNRIYPGIKCHTIVTDICHSHRMEHLFRTYRPEIVFHAAAYKHVPMLEDNPVESILNNVDGTRKLALLAVKYDVDKFIMVSTDKAVNPTSVMGCSKRICEIYCQSLSKSGKENSGCKFITTRFGNVLGSNGSVISIFREQIRRGGPVTVTHPDMVRYFMLIPEACQLVLEACVSGHGGEIFVFDMGNPVRIADLAKRMIELSGRRNIRIEYTGLRPGEKLHEDLLKKEEESQTVSYCRIKVAKAQEYDFKVISEQIDKLIETARTYDSEKILLRMRQIVPEYNNNTF